MVVDVSCVRLYFCLYLGAIKSPQIIEFLKSGDQTISRKHLIIWDGLAAAWCAPPSSPPGGAFKLEHLPAYVLELNSVEYLWAYPKQCALADLCVHDLDHLSDTVRVKLKSMQRRLIMVTIAELGRAKQWREAPDSRDGT